MKSRHFEYPKGRIAFCLKVTSRKNEGEHEEATFSYLAKQVPIKIMALAKETLLFNHFII